MWEHRTVQYKLNQILSITAEGLADKFKHNSIRSGKPKGGKSLSTVIVGSTLYQNMLYSLRLIITGGRGTVTFTVTN